MGVFPGFNTKTLGRLECKWLLQVVCQAWFVGLGLPTSLRQLPNQLTQRHVRNKISPWNPDAQWRLLPFLLLLLLLFCFCFFLLGGGFPVTLKQPKKRCLVSPGQWNPAFETV